MDFNINHNPNSSYLIRHADVHSTPPGSKIDEKRQTTERLETIDTRGYLHHYIT